MTFTPKHRKWIFIFFFAILVLLSLYMIKNFLSGIFVGALLAYFLYRPYTFLKEKLKSRYLAQAILGIASILCIFLFAILIVIPLVNETYSLYNKSGEITSSFFKEIKDCPAHPQSSSCVLAQNLSPLLGEKTLEQRAQEFFQKTSLLVVESFGGILQGVISFAIFIFVLFVSLFYFLEHGTTIRDTILEVIPLDTKHKSQIFERLKETINAVVGGNIIVSILQGIAGGLIFFLLGIHSPVFWGFIIAILAFIPIAGPGLIWVPAAIILVVEGNITSAIILTLFCLIFMTALDYYLKPRLIGQKIRLSTFAIFLGVVGGISAFGILGLFFGPIILALLVTSVEIYKEMIKESKI